MITRFDSNQRMSQLVQHNNTLYLAGQVGEGATVAEQTQDCLDKVDALLAKGGSSRDKILQAVIWLDSMDDFAEMNGVWDAWVPEGAAPARACGEARLALPKFKVEVIVIAATDD